MAMRYRYIMQTYARPNLVFTHGEGARLYDAHGKEYLDFAAGIAVNALGALQRLHACMLIQASEQWLLVACMPAQPRSM